MKSSILGAAAALIVVGAFMVIDRTLLHWYAAEGSTTEERIEDLERALEQLGDDDPFPPLPPTARPQVEPRFPQAPRDSRVPQEPVRPRTLPPLEAPEQPPSIPRLWTPVPSFLDCASTETFDYLRSRCVPKEPEGPNPLDCAYGERFDFVRKVCVPSPTSCAALEEFDFIRERCVPVGN